MQTEAGDKHGTTENFSMPVDNVPGELISLNPETKKQPQMILVCLLAIPYKPQTSLLLAGCKFSFSGISGPQTGTIPCFMKPLETYAIGEPFYNR